MSYGEISDKIGYKNPQHFSTAFKKKFGISPSALLKGSFF
jgi:AraC-like DNA-binding protein